MQKYDMPVYSTPKYFFRPILCKASTMYLLSRQDTTAHGMRAVYTASSHSFNPFTGTSTYKNNIKQNKRKQINQHYIFVIKIR